MFAKKWVLANEVQFVFDAIVDDYPTMEQYLEWNARIGFPKNCYKPLKLKKSD